MNYIKSFMLSLRLSLINEIPYWLYVMVVAVVCSIIDSRTFNAFVLAIGLYAGIGAWVVFKKYKIESAQLKDHFDMKGALKNLYRTLWWPWYILKSK